MKQKCIRTKLYFFKQNIILINISFQTKHNSKIDARGGEAAAARQPNRKAIAVSKSSLESKRFAKLPQTRNERFAEEKVTQSN
jgi:hypothetical protein